MSDELLARRLADIIRYCYERGKRDKINEIRNALLFEELDDD